MELEQSQLVYLQSRKKSYDLKYGILNHIIKENLKDGMNILELFGGVGLTSCLIQKKIIPKKQEVLEICEKCIEILKRKEKNFKNFIVKNQNAFSFDDYSDYDYIFIDNAFTLSKFSIFDRLFNRISKMNKGNIILTETGIFNLRFNKKSPEKHFEEVNDRFIKKYGLFIKNVYYTSNFSIIHLIKNKTEMKIEKWTALDKSWRMYVP